MPTRTLQSIVSQRSLVIASPSTTVADAAVSMRAKGVGSVVVEERGQLAGIFTERDLLNRVVAAGKDPASTALAEVMTAEVIGMEADRPLLHALHLMHQNNFRHVPVLQADKPIGMVSARDALGVEWQDFQREIKLADDIAEILA